MKKISILTLFPEMFETFKTTSIIKRALAHKDIEIECINIRDFSQHPKKKVDDTPYGGGPGMLLMLQPVLDCLNAVKTSESHVILCAAFGKTFQQSDAHRFSQKKHLIIICGHYEGIDARIHQYVDEIISIGDYVLTGGELAAMVISDAVIRLEKGVILQSSHEQESFENGLLEHPQYTKPADYKGDKVPDVLVSGHHENIRIYNLKESLKLTQKNRPDLLAKKQLTSEEIKLLKD